MAVKKAVYEYHMECGCVLTQDQLIKKKTKQVCPKHFTRIVEKYGFCIYPGCDKKFKCSFPGSSQTRCDVHRIKKKQDDNKVDRDNKKYDDWDLYKPDYADESRWDCKFRLECIDKYDNSGFKSLPCKNCNRYEAGPTDFHYADPAYQHGEMVTI